MKRLVSRALMALALCCMDESRRAWSAAMQAEFQVAERDGGALPFAAGCLAAAWRELLTREEGRFTLTSYALALGLMLPMAALQIACAVLNQPYLYPGSKGLAGALLIGGKQEVLMRSVYQGAVPAIAFLLLLLGLGQICIAWSMLDRNWSRVTRLAALSLAAAATLVIFLGALFIDCSQALLQSAVLAVELAAVWMVAGWHEQLRPAGGAEHPG